MKTITISRAVSTYEDLRSQYKRMLLVWADLIEEGDHDTAASIRVKVVKVRDEAETVKRHLASHGVEV